MVAVKRLGVATVPQVQKELLESQKLRKSDGQIYTTLERLLIPGLMDSEIRQSRNALGRLRPMRVYWLTEAGHAALTKEIERLANLQRVNTMPAGLRHA
jgi:DNA-binding PadR family transcriptional regulator